MIAYEIQLRYVIRDKIQEFFFLTKFFSDKNFFFQRKFFPNKFFVSTNIFFQRNFFSDNFFLLGKIFFEKINFVRKNIFIGKKFVTKINSWILSQAEFCLRFPVHFFSCLGQIDAYHH